MTLGAALSNMDIEFIDSTDGTALPDNAIPTTGDHERLPNPVIGSWQGLLLVIDMRSTIT